MLVKSAAMSTKENPRGRNLLINTSIVGRHPLKMAGIYGMTKAALDNMVKFLSDHFMEDGVRVNGIAPGIIRTATTEHALDLSAFNKRQVGSAD